MNTLDTHVCCKHSNSSTTDSNLCRVGHLVVLTNIFLRVGSCLSRYLSRCQLLLVASHTARVLPPHARAQAPDLSSQLLLLPSLLAHVHITYVHNVR